MSDEKLEIDEGQRWLEDQDKVPISTDTAKKITQEIYNPDYVKSIVNAPNAYEKAREFLRKNPVAPADNMAKYKSQTHSQRTAEKLTELEGNQGVFSCTEFPDLQWSVFDGSNTNHEGLIFGTWCKHIKSFREYSHMNKAEFQVQRRIIGEIVERCPPIVLHSNSEKGEPLFGFICSEYQKTNYGERQVLHFMYVRNMWRRRGFGNLMMKLSFNKWKNDTIFHSFPMRSVPHFADKWLLHKKKTAAYYQEKK